MCVFFQLLINGSYLEEKVCQAEPTICGLFICLFEYIVPAGSFTQFLQRLKVVEPLQVAVNAMGSGLSKQ